MTPLVDQLPLVADDQREAILRAPRTSDAHRALMADLPAMQALEVGGKGTAEFLCFPISVVAWNLERCLFPEDSAAHIAPLRPQVVLLSEMDKGMARTGQRHTTAAMADALGMHFAYGVEFHEMDLGGPSERKFCRDDFNTDGWHGNAILSSSPFVRLALIRLDDHGHWFVPSDGAADPGQPRVGGRMAVAAVIKVDDGEACFVSTHLESAAGVDHRDRQMHVLLEAIEEFAPDMPVIIGGDLNTGNHLPDFDWRKESLFETARRAGYHWDANAPGTTTRPSLITLKPSAVMKLDWFAVRGVRGDDAQIIPSTDANGRPLSDHDAVAAQFQLMDAGR
ncbi:MAG: endonuclease/exonuclease/phosphatase family protein [Hyphomicrobiales bacterium]